MVLIDSWYIPILIILVLLLLFLRSCYRGAVETFKEVLLLCLAGLGRGGVRVEEKAFLCSIEKRQANKNRVRMRCLIRPDTKGPLLIVSLLWRRCVWRVSGSPPRWVLNAGMRRGVMTHTHTHCVTGSDRLLESAIWTPWVITIVSWSSEMVLWSESAAARFIPPSRSQKDGLNVQQ